MQKFIRILMLLAVTMLAGSNVWAQDDPGNGEGNPLGVIYYDDQDATVTTAGGMLEFFNNDACDFDSEGNYQISANENVPLEWLDADCTVYIKATPNPGHTLGTADAEGAVTFISVTVWEAMTPSGARQMTRGDGNEDETAIPVYAVDGQRGVYMFQMPADGSNVLVEAQFPLKAKLGDPGYNHIQFIDYKADPTTGEMTAVTRSTEELKDANNQPVPVYVLDGTETMLGTPGEVEDEDNITEDDFTEAWYVCLATANGGNDLEYIALSGKECALELADYCKIHLILTDGCQMAVYGPETGQDGLLGNVGASLTIYGQGGTDASNQSTEGELFAESDGNAIFLSGDLTINGGQICFRSENGTAISNNQSAIAIRGGTVQAEGTSGISSEGNVTISGGEVNAIGASDAIFTSSDGVTISGGIVNAIGGDRGIALDEGVLTISGGEVNVGGEVNASDENDMSYGIYSASTPTTENGSTIVISDGTVNAFGATAIFAAGDLDISGGTVTAIGDEVAIDSEENLTISGGTVNANSSNNFAVYSVGKLTISDDPDDAVDAVVVAQGKENAIFAAGDVEISGGTVEATSDVSAIYSSGNVEISGGTVEANGVDDGIRLDAGDLTINGGTLTAIASEGDCIYLDAGDVVINDGEVTAISNDGNFGIFSDNGDVTISGGQVEASAIFALNDITLGWTASSDYIMAGSYETATGAVTTATGCRFVSLDESAGEGLPTATAIVPGGSQAHTTAAAGDGFAVSDIAGRTLRPVDGYLLGLCPGLGVAQSNPSAQALEFTMAGDETTHYYIYKKDDQLLLSVGGVEDGFNGTMYEAGTPVEILQDNRTATAPTAMPTAYTGFVEEAHTMFMPAKDLKIVAYRAYKTDVKYLKNASDENPSSVEKAYILDGHDHTLYGGWYVLEEGVDTRGWMKDSEGKWMLTGNGNMFECRGDVGIILADGSALCVGTEDYPFTGNAVITCDKIINFYSQSVPTEKEGDKRGRMEFITDNGKAIEASSFLELRNVKLKAQGSPGSDGLVTANNNIRIIGGQIDVNAGNTDGIYAFYTPQTIELDWKLSFDEIFGSKYYAYDGLKIASGKTFVNIEDKSEKFSGTVTTPSDLDDKTLVGQVIYDLKRGGAGIAGGGGIGGGGGGGGAVPSPTPSPTPPTSIDYGAISGSGGPMVVDDDNVVVAAVNRVDRNGTAILVSLEGNNENNVVVNGNTIPDMLQRLIDQMNQSAIRHTQHVFVVTNRENLNNSVSSKGDIIVGGEVTANGNITLTSGDGKITITGKTNAGSGEISIGGGEASTGGGTITHNTASISTELTASGTGADADLKAQGKLAGAIYDAVSTKMIAAGDGSSTVGQITQASFEDEISRIQVQLNYVRQLLSQTPQGDAMYNSYLNLINFYEEKISQLQVTLHTSTALDPSLGIGGKQNISIGFGTKVTGDHSGALGDARTRATGDGTRLTLAFVPVDDDPDDVLPEGEIRLFMTQAELLSIAIYQREHPDEVKKARARGALMIDTTTPETTAIIGRLMVTERAEPVDGHWYGLDGRRLPSAPTAKGVYVHRGRKVVIR